MKQYFLYECKRKLPAFAAFTVISLLICSTFSPYFDNIMAAQTACLGVMAVLLPAYLFSDFYSKKGADFYYSLPITKEKLVIVKILVGLTFLFASYTIFFWGSALKIYNAERNAGYVIGLYPLWLYLTNLALSIPLFGYSAFAFTQANNILDGFVHLVAYTFLVFVLLEFVSEYFKDFPIENPYFFVSFETLDQNTVLWQAKIYLSNTADPEYFLKRATITPEKIAAVVTQAVLGLSGLAGTIFSVRFQKAEDLGGVSKSPFSYRVLIPFYLFTALCLVNWNIDLYGFEAMSNVFITAAGYLGYCLYARSFVIGKKNAIVFIATLAVTALFVYLFNFVFVL